MLLAENGGNKVTYRINQSVGIIKSPVDVLIGEHCLHFENGKELASAAFDKNYLISSITAKADHIVIILEENKRVNDISWVGKEAVSFF